MFKINDTIKFIKAYPYNIFDEDGILIEKGAVAKITEIRYSKRHWWNKKEEKDVGIRIPAVKGTGLKNYRIFIPIAGSYVEKADDGTPINIVEKHSFHVCFEHYRIAELDDPTKS